MIDFRVDSFDHEKIQGFIGSASVLIPDIKMQGFRFNQQRGRYEITLSDGRLFKIENGELLRARCREWMCSEGKY